MKQIKVEKNFKPKLIEEKKWHKVVRRSNSPLCFSFTAVGPTMRNEKLKFNSEVNNYLMLADDVYGGAEDIEQLKNRMVGLYRKNGLLLKDYFSTLESDCEKYLLFIDELRKETMRRLGHGELRKLFREYMSHSFGVMSHIWPVLAIQEWVVDEIRKELKVYINPRKQPTQFNRVLQVLMAPERLSNVQKGRNAMLRVALKVKENNKLINEDIKKEIERVYDKFVWISDHTLKLKYESLSSFSRKIKKEASGEPEKKLEKEQSAKEQARKDKLALIKKYKFNKKLILLSQVAADLPYARFLRIEVLSEGSYRLRDFFAKIAKEIGVGNISDLFFWEISDVLAGERINLAEVQKRKKGFGLLVLDKKIWVFSLEQAIKVRDKMEAVSGFKGELKGVSACLGYAKGRVRILFFHGDISKIQKGDILVTSMTTPEFVPAMEKSAAIVTDEGGISCHAAIVSRELGIPCIIGTKTATKVLKDGDMVEVDSDKGVVRVIK